MANEFRDFRQTYVKIHEDIERLSRILTPSYLSIHEQMERAFESIRRQHLDTTRLAEVSRLASPQFMDISRANERWQDLIAQATTSTRVLDDMRRIHETWRHTIQPLQERIAQLEASVKLSLGNVSYQLTVAERLFTRIDLEALQRSIAPSVFAYFKPEDFIAGVTGTYQKLADSIDTLSDLTLLPAFALPGATREVFVAAHAVKFTCVPEESDQDKDASEVQLIEDIEHDTSACLGLLQALDPSLARPYIGARDALSGRNADRGRHILSSLRELWNHLLRRLAPDKDVIAWLPSDDKELLHDGRPTRQARVMYVCRHMNHEPLTDFVVQDTRALVKLVDFFNRVHELEPGLTDDQLRAVLLRTDSWLLYILQISERTR